MADQGQCNESEVSDMELGYSASVIIERTMQNERKANLLNRHSLLGRSYLGWDHQGKRITVPNDDDALSKLSCDMLPKLSQSVISLLRNNEEISQSTKLKNWCICPAIGKRGIKIVGYKCDNGKCRESTVIKHRLKNNLVVSETFRYYTLVGPLVCTDDGVPLSIISAFKNGFPMSWKNEVDNYLKWLDEKNTQDECCTPVGKRNTRLLIREEIEINENNDGLLDYEHEQPSLNVGQEDVTILPNPKISEEVIPATPEDSEDKTEDSEQEQPSLNVRQEDVTILPNPQVRDRVIPAKTEDSEDKTEDSEDKTDDAEDNKSTADFNNVTSRLSLPPKNYKNTSLPNKDENIKANKIVENDEEVAPADDNCFKVPLSNAPAPVEKFPIQRTDGIKLSNWSVIIISNTPVIEGLVQCDDGKVRIYRSSGIARVTRRKRNVITQSGTKYILVGKMDKTHTLHNGMSVEIADKFMFGFPRNWKALIEKCQINNSNSSVSVGRRSTSAKRTRSRTQDKNIRRSGRSIGDDIIKDLRSLFESADSEEENDKTVIVSRSNNVKSSTTKKQAEQTKKTPALASRKRKATPKPVPINVSVVDMDEAPAIPRRSRSRRLSKTPVAKKSPKKPQVKTLKEHRLIQQQRNKEEDESREDLSNTRKRRRESSPPVDFFCSLEKVIAIVELGSKVDAKPTEADDNAKEKKAKRTNNKKRESKKRKSTNKSKKEAAVPDVVKPTKEKEESSKNTDEPKNKKSSKRTTRAKPKKNLVVNADTEDDKSKKEEPSKKAESITEKGRRRKSKGIVKTDLPVEKEKKSVKKSATTPQSPKTSKEPPKKKQRKSTIVVEKAAEEKKESPKKLLKVGEWTKTEKAKLKRLTKGGNHDWENIAEKFGRSADDCKSAYGLLFICKPKKRKTAKKPVPKKIEITAGKGTMKQREQIFQAYESLKPTKPVEDFFNFDNLTKNDNNFWSGMSNLEATQSTTNQAQGYSTPFWCKGNNANLAETPKTTTPFDDDTQSCYTPLATRLSPEQARKENHKISVHLKKSGLSKIKLTKKMKMEQKITKKFVPNLKDITNMENSFLSDDSVVQDEYFSP